MTGRHSEGATEVRVATVYKSARYGDFRPVEMSTARWVHLSEALARSGFEVDVVLDAETTPESAEPAMSWVSLESAEWWKYDVVIAFFHRGFETLQRYGAADHPFIISDLGSVVGPDDGSPGVYFFGPMREQLWATQQEIAAASRGVAILTQRSRKLWVQCHGRAENVRLVPTGVPSSLPAPARNPFTGSDRPVALYLGNIYRDSQHEMNRYWQDRLSALGRQLLRRGVGLCFVGIGHTDRIDETAVTNLGSVLHEESWNYQLGADVGVVLAQGPVQDNESSKIYNYLRVGLPVVSESPVPNNGLIDDTGLGFVVEFENDEEMADAVVAAAEREWDRRVAIEYMVTHHSWDLRAAAYHDWILEELRGAPLAASGRHA